MPNIYIIDFQRKNPRLRFDKKKYVKIFWANKKMDVTKKSNCLFNFFSASIRIAFEKIEYDLTF